MGALAVMLGARGGVLHLDWLDFAIRLVGPVDWTSPASIAALIAKAQALLPSDVVAVPVGRMAVAQVAARPDLARALATKPGGAGPLRALLADTRLADATGETLTRVAAAVRTAVVALDVPAPIAFAQMAAVAAGSSPPVADEDLADDAAVHLAAFLRTFAAAPVGLLIVDEALDDAAFRDFAAPVAKVAAHYGWDVAGGAGSMTFAVVTLPLGFWSGQPAPPLPPLACVRIPPVLEPEVVAAGVARLRAAIKGPA